MISDVRNAKLVIDDMFTKLGGQKIDCPDSEMQAEYRLLYVACCRIRGSTKKVKLRWGRYAFPPTFPKSVEPHAIGGNWRYYAPDAEWRCSFSFFDPDELAYDPDDILRMNVSIREGYFGNDALVVAWLYDGLDDEERFSEEDRQQAYRFRIITPDSELYAQYQSEGIPQASFDVSEEDIKWLDKVVGHFANTSSGGYESVLRLAYVSGVLLNGYMGEAWRRRHIWAGLVGDARGKTLGELGSIKRFATEKHIFRAIALAEIFYNLQAAPGIREKARGLLNENIESVLGELEGVQLLCASGRPIELVAPNNVKGESYDLKTKLTDGTSVACEIKTKFEDTQFSPQTVLRTLGQACKQLPADGLNAIVMKVPEAWLDQVDVEEMLEQAATEIFRQRSTASAIFFHWHLWTKVDGHISQNFKITKHTNDAARHTHPELLDLIRAPLTRYRRLYQILDIPHMSFTPTAASNFS